MRSVRPWPILIFGLLALTFATVAEAHKDHNKTPTPAATSVQSGAAEPSSAPAGHGAMAMPAGDQMSGMGSEARPTTFTGRLIDWLGRWHPSVVHFPISLFIVVGGLEAWALARRKPAPTETMRVLIALAAMSAVVAVALGWMALGWSMSEDKPLEAAHRALGSTIALLALATWGAHERFYRWRRSRTGAVYGVLLVSTVLAIAINGYIGGSLIHGANHMAF